MASDFTRLSAYRQAAALADDARYAVLEWSAFDRWSAGVQLVRAADSVGANIAEAIGRRHRADRQRLLYIARASLYETEHWLLRGRARGLPTGDCIGRIDELARTLNGLIKHLP